MKQEELSDHPVGLTLNIEGRTLALFYLFEAFHDEYWKGQISIFPVFREM